MKAIVIADKLIKNEKENSKLKIGGGSWSINLDKIDLSDINEIEYITEKFRYTISTENAIGLGFIRILGGEKKLIVPIKYWEIN